jgi:hypothetical protein
MAEDGRRPILSLKSPPARMPATPFTKPPARSKGGQPADPQPGWKCKPCGARIEVPLTGAPETIVRCPACNARLGRVEQFLADPPPATGLRARRT